MVVKSLEIRDERLEIMVFIERPRQGQELGRDDR